MSRTSGRPTRARAGAVAAGAALALAMSLSATARAQSGLVARDTADVGPRGSGAIGVFNPLTWAVADGMELTGHPLVFLVSPNAILRVAHGGAGDWRFAGEYGLSVPTPAMKLTQGYLFPSWSKSPEKRQGFWVVPRAGLVASQGAPTAGVVTLRADVAVGVHLGRSDLTPWSGVAPLDLLFAPVNTGFRARLGLGYDHPLGSRWRLRGSADLWLHGENPSPVAVTASVGADLAIGASSRLALGAIWYNADTRAIDRETHEPVRSNDFFPTLDFIWAWGGGARSGDAESL